MSFQDLEAGRLRQPQQQRLQQDPSQAVASGIFRINTAVSSFSRLVNSLGTPKDTLELRDKLWVFFFLVFGKFCFSFSYAGFFYDFFFNWDGNSTSGFCFCLLALVKSYWEPIEVLSICAISDCTLWYDCLNLLLPLFKPKLPKNTHKQLRH